MRRLLTTCILVLFVGSVYAEIYTWTDANGRPVYSQTQKRGSVAVELDPPPMISGTSKANQGPSQTTQEQLQSIEESNHEAAQERKAGEEKVAAEKKLKKDCADAKNSLTVLQRGGNTRYQLPDGSIAYLSPEEREERRQGIQAFIDENCK